ncbi:hypothetical protein H8K32_10410 [Undibacterium jejuense]|uniref:DUF4156 domain-containing protein n=1 Tax=Undibacterium jejuense TaxID=1344949 RepID=A0A923KIE3_9BURK|nr:hypothetical protein [Undibacterium jejuense]MBC3862512.1 hypothetical protein [Undibacterium jejuense]
MNKTMQICSILAMVCALSACVSVSESNMEGGKRIAEMSQQAIATCGQGNVDKVTTTSYTCKANK